MPILLAVSSPSVNTSTTRRPCMIFNCPMLASIAS